MKGWPQTKGALSRKVWEPAGPGRHAERSLRQPLPDRGMFPAIHDPQTGFVSTPSAHSCPWSIQAIFLASAPEWCLYAGGWAARPMEAEEGKGDAPEPPCPQESQQPTRRCRPHLVGFEAGTRGLSCRRTVGAEPLTWAPHTGLRRQGCRSGPQPHSTLACVRAAPSGVARSWWGLAGSHQGGSRRLSSMASVAPRPRRRLCGLLATGSRGVCRHRPRPGRPPPARPCGPVVPAPPRVPQGPPPLPGEAGPGTPNDAPSPALMGARGSSSPPGWGPTAQRTRGRDRMAEVWRPLDLFSLFNIQ